MLPTFVIGLREGLEAALIVGIIAAFLRKQGRRDLLRWVFVGVGIAIGLCLAAGIALNVLSEDLPQKQQEGLETVIGVLAVGMVTYMVVWMKRNSRGLKGQLEGLAADAMGGTSRGARAMIAMAFLAVLREGIETVVFLLAAFNGSTSGADAPAGAALGIAVAVGLGYGIYRGGVRINLSKFFRATGLVLVLVAAGLVVNALRTAHEAGWIDIGQGRTVDLTWLVDPGSVQASLLTGMLGLQGRPVVIEVLGWLLYLIPVGVYVAWPPGRSVARQTASRVLLASGVVLALGTVALAVAAPSPPARGAATVTASGTLAATVSGHRMTIADGSASYRLTYAGPDSRAGLAADRYASTARAAVDSLPPRLSWSQVAALNGGNLPIGLRATAGTDAQVRYRQTATVTAWLEPRTQRVLELVERRTVTAAVLSGGRTFPLARPANDTTNALSRAETAAAAAAARSDLDVLDRSSLLIGLAWTGGGLALVLLLTGGALAVSPQARRERERTPARDGQLIGS
jgi:high-affinity iron transporter